MKVEGAIKPQLRLSPAKSINKQMYKNPTKGQSSSAPSLSLMYTPPLTSENGIYFSASLNLNPALWPAVTHRIRQKWHWSQFQTWPLWEDGQLPCPPSGCQLPCKKSSHMETLTPWGGRASHADTILGERKMPNQPRCSIHSSWAAISVNSKDILNILPPATPANNRWSIHLSLTQITELSEIINCCHFKTLSFGWFVIQQ